MNVLMEVFLNTIWQTAAVALLAWAVLRWLPNINAATREALWWAVLAFVVLLPALRILPGERPAYREPIAASAPATFDAAPEPVAAPPIHHVALALDMTRSFLPEALAGLAPVRSL